MTIEEVHERLAEIEHITRDNETAHVMEDDLYIDVLRAIANGQRHARDLAREALKAREIQYDRWYA